MAYWLKTLSMGHDVHKGNAVPATDGDYLRLSLEAIQTARQHLHESSQQNANRKRFHFSVLAAGASTSSSARAANFYRCQCRVLVQHLVRVQGVLQEINEISGPPVDISKSRSSCTRPPWPMQAVRDLYRLLTQARILIKDCCNESSSLKAALRYAHSSQAFADICKEIVWWKSAIYFHNNIRHVERPNMELEDFPQARLDYKDQYVLEMAAESDRKSLKEELQKWNQEHLCSAEDCGSSTHDRNGDPPNFCLATQILRSWIDPKDLLAGNEDSPEQADRQTLNLWKFHKEVLRAGNPLGSGAFGSVSQATWLGDKYAQKVFSTVHGLRSFPGEASALARMTHPHIVQVLACSEDSILMELMSTDLCKYMSNRMERVGANQPFSLPAAMDLMLQIAEAMRFIHSQKMVHRDLKSGNILVDPIDINPGLAGSEDGYVIAKIADFGLAKTKREITAYSHLTADTGSRLWMAPEIFGAHKDNAHLMEAFPMRADVYSFGIVCFEILSGEQPFKDVMLSELYKKLTAQPVPLRPQLPPSCPGDLASLIRRCWDADPRRRPAFKKVCRMLRYLKGLQMTGLNEGQLSLRNLESPFQKLLKDNPVGKATIEMQGPWGTLEAGSIFSDCTDLNLAQLFSNRSPPGITAIKLFFKDSKRHYVSALRVMFDLNGRSLETEIRGMDFNNGASRYVSLTLELQVSQSTLDLLMDIARILHEAKFMNLYTQKVAEIVFDYPKEYPVQVKGSFTTKEKFYGPFFGPFVTSLVFIANLGNTLGPYGDFHPDDEHLAFSSKPGKVVGFFGTAGHLLEKIGVLTVPFADYSNP